MESFRNSNILPVIYQSDIRHMFTLKARITNPLVRNNLGVIPLGLSVRMIDLLVP